MRFAIALIALAALGACRTPCPTPYSGPTTLQFECEDGSDLTVTFSRNPDLATIAEEGYTTLTLPASASGPGYRYSGGGAAFRSRGATVGWTRPGVQETICRERAEAARVRAG
ncbi:MAG: MliC family protein [Hyphomonadaceae bacterium]|nr:MliC family protein [Hyphomonadaceae bacterium]MBX3511366.1 MliC family protein [Hyphomonadaceae bacterium]